MLFAWVNLVLGLATLAVMIGAWFGPGRVVAVVAIATACLWVYQPPDNLLTGPSCRWPRSASSH